MYIQNECTFKINVHAKWMYIQNECTFKMNVHLAYHWSCLPHSVYYCHTVAMFATFWLWLSLCGHVCHILSTFIFNVHSFWMYIHFPMYIWPNAHHSMINDVHSFWMYIHFDAHWANVHSFWMYIRPNAHHLNLLSSSPSGIKLYFCQYFGSKTLFTTVKIFDRMDLEKEGI